MVLELRFPSGRVDVTTLVERPTDTPTASRRFDMAVDYAQSEFFVLWESGTVEYFNWTGRKFETTKATLVEADAMSIGANPIPRRCVPKELSAASSETLELYEQLVAFKDSPSFATYGFARTGPHNGWLERAKRADGNPEEVYNQLNFLPGAVLTLGLQYLNIRTSGAQPDGFIEDLERTIEAGVRLATCRERALEQY